MLHTGDVVAKRYRVDRVLGRGGMAEVYQVWDQQRRVALALKRLQVDVGFAPEKVALFQKEAQALEQLKHPAIVRFYEYVHEGSIISFLMDYVEGSDLRQEIRTHKNGLELERIRAVLTPICAALQFAHGRGVIHCDIKPENILLDSAGKALLSDFGIAQVVSGPYSRGGSSTAGTSAYMAPEQIQNGVVSSQSDLYSLGVLLFEMLTGCRPFTGENAPDSCTEAGDRIRWEQVHHAAPAPSQYKAGLSRQVDAVILRCLQKDPSLRFSSAMDLFNAFELAQSQAQLAGPGGQIVKSFDGWKYMQWMVVIALALIVAALPAYWMLTRPAANPPIQTVLPGLTASPTATKTKLPTSSLDEPACMTFQVKNTPRTEIEECVTGIMVEPDGKLKVFFRWKMTTLSNIRGVNVPADQGNNNMYLMDDLGNRLDAVDTGDGTNQDVVLKNGESKEGWFLFPKPAETASFFYFHDDDNGGKVQVGLPRP